MKIALFHELDTGGARRAANEFSKALKHSGHVVDLYYVDEHESVSEKEYYSKVYYYKFIERKWRGGDWKVKLYKDTVELYKLYTLHKKIAFDIHSRHYDFAFVHGSKYTQAPFILQLLRIKSLYYCQEPLRMIYESLFAIPRNIHPLKNQYEKVIRLIKKNIDRKNITKANVILTNSSFTRQNILHAYGLKAIVCHMGVDTNQFYPTLKKDNDLFFIGSREEYDGYPLFKESISLMKKKPKVIYLLRGESYVSDAELRDNYSRSRIVISFGYNEPFGLVPLEAMACQATVVVLDEGGYRDSVSNNKTGILVKKDPKQVAQVLDSLLQNKAFLEKLAYNGLLEVRSNWQWERAAKQVLEAAIHYA